MMRVRLDDHGGATIWVLSAGLVTVLVALAMAMAGAVIVARHRAQAAADLAALAAAARLTEGVAAACSRAAEFAQANGAQLRSCLADGWDMVVSVSVRPPVVWAVSGSVVATARAGPAEPGAYDVQRRQRRTAVVAGPAATRQTALRWLASGRPRTRQVAQGGALAHRRCIACRRPRRTEDEIEDEIEDEEEIEDDDRAGPVQRPGAAAHVLHCGIGTTQRRAGRARSGKMHHGA